MIALERIRVGRRIRYTRIDTDHMGEEIFRKTVDIRLISSKSTTASGKKHYIIVDADSGTIPEASYFLNEYLVNNNASVNTRRKAGETIVKFMSFNKLMVLNIRCLNENDINRLKKFLQGEGKEQNKNSTVNSELGIIRSFLTALHIECEPLFRKTTFITTEIEDKDFTVRSEGFTYTSNLKVNKKNGVPKYITLRQYILLCELAKAARDWTAIIIMHLMFRYGMRIGEVLGLTHEDFVYMRRNGKDVPTLIIRNRLSSGDDQQNKRKDPIQSRNYYESQEYIDRWKNDEYSHYYLTESDEFEKTFIRYMETSREKAEKEHPENYAMTEADIVHPESFKKKGLEKNHYIFINRLGKRMNAKHWSDILKDYFVAAGIELDKGKKQYGLSHRFRHGFAMLRAHFMNPPVPVQVLQKMLHHKNISTTMRYYNPTPEDEFKIKSEMQEAMYQNFPEFRNRINDFLKDM